MIDLLTNPFSFYVDFFLDRGMSYDTFMFIHAFSVAIFLSIIILGFFMIDNFSSIKSKEDFFKKFLGPSLLGCLIVSFSLFTIPVLLLYLFYRYWTNLPDTTTEIEEIVSKEEKNQYIFDTIDQYSRN